VVWLRFSFSGGGWWLLFGSILDCVICYLTLVLVFCDVKNLRYRVKISAKKKPVFFCVCAVWVGLFCCKAIFTFQGFLNLFIFGQWDFEFLIVMLFVFMLNF
jgi:hypothetical protein